MPSSTSSTIPHFAPTLPTELIEQIMQEANFSKSDLVQCCLISRQFLNPARKLLYRHLDVYFSEVIANQRQDGYLGRPASLVLPSKKTALLLRTFQNNFFLRQLPHSLHFLDIECTVSSPVPWAKTRGQVMQDVFALLSNVERVRLDSRFSNSVHYLVAYVVLPSIDALKLTS